MVPTPTAADGSYDAKHVLDAIAKIGRGLRGHDRLHVVLLAGTVMPGTCEGPAAALLQKTSGRALGPKLGLCYSPVFGALGNIIHDYSHPDFLLLGASDSAASEMAAKLLSSIHRNHPPVLHRTLIDAELAKVALNTFVITKISFANMIGELCRSIPGADADQVLSVLGKDRRIGPHFLRAAMPYGGPCFSRDVGALVATGAHYGIDVPIANAAASTNHSLQDAIVASLKSSTSVGGTIAIIGLAFRNNTDVTVGSPAIEIAERLARDGYQIRAWDPLARPTVGFGVHVAGSMTECLSGADVALIANDNPRCAEIPPDIRRPDGQPLIVLDYWRMLDIAGKQGQLDIRR
jgi:UDPglucose 6-dehydrogenase